MIFRKWVCDESKWVCIVKRESVKIESGSVQLKLRKWVCKVSKWVCTEKGRFVRSQSGSVL